MALVDHWPLFGLRVRTPRLELRYPDDELAGQLGELVAAGIHDPSWMPLGVPFTDAPVEEQPRNTLVVHWRMRAELRPDSWHLTLGVLVDGEAVGGTSLMAEHFAERRTLATGSWLGRAFQGPGPGLRVPPGLPAPRLRRPRRRGGHDGGVARQRRVARRHCQAALRAERRGPPDAP